VAPASASTPETVIEDQNTTDHQYRNGYNLNISPRLNWRESDDDTASVQMFAYRKAAVDETTDTMSDVVGTPQYSVQYGHSVNDSDVYKVTINRLMPLAGGSFTARLSYSDFVSDVDTGYLQETSHGAQLLQSDTDARVSGVNTAGKWTYPVNDHSKFVMGYEGDWTDQINDLVQTGYVSSSAITDTTATVARLATYAQDEYNVSPRWGWYAGLRWESVTTRTDAASGDVDNRSAVLSPSLQTVWRFGDQMGEQSGGGYQDLIRWSLSRAYRPPGTTSLLPRVFLSPLNDAFHPDTEGNPNLRPELSLGMETAFEHYMKGGGMFSINVFERQIDDVIRTLTTLDPDGRWVSEPINLAHAFVYGIEIEGKTRLDQLIDHAPPIEVHGNVARYWSQVSGIPGPYNYLSSQTPASANFGMDYVPSRKLSMGGNITWVPSVTTQLSDTQQAFTGGKTGLDGYVLWKFKPGWQFRVAATNLWHPDYITGGFNDYNGDINTNTTVAHTWVNWSTSLNVKF
jgi:iron complex outermembrane receptor protein